MRTFYIHVVKIYISEEIRMSGQVKKVEPP